MDVAFITIILQLIFLECILSIDNAAVLGAMVAPLPNDRPVPWPRTLRGVLSKLDPLLGPQPDHPKCLDAYPRRDLPDLPGCQALR